MAGNSQRRGAIRKTGTKKGAVKGSGGQVSKSRESRGATPPAEVRTGHVAGRRAAAAKKGATFGRTAGGTSRGGRDAEGAAGSGGRSSGGSADRGASRGNDGGASRGYDGGARRGSGSGSGGASRGSGRVAGMRNPRVTGGGTMRRGKGLPETVVGRNPVVESLRAGVPATALYLAAGLQPDERITEVVQLAASAGIALMEISRHDLDKLTAGAIHQGVALAVPPYKYADPRDLLELAAQSDQPALIVAIDGVTDPRNLGAIVRSAAAFGANGVV
ncbi:MAG: RNA methyltransferase substrate-binding domain-containing protein, partial [Nakamurella sp.]